MQAILEQTVYRFPCHAISTVIPMTDDNSGFWAEAWQRLRPHALAAVVEFGQYLILWAVVVGAHVIKILMVAAGIEPIIITAITWMERYVFIASFASFFCRVLIRVYRSFGEEY